MFLIALLSVGVARATSSELRSGTLHMVWGDPSSAGGTGVERYFLADGSTNAEVALSAAQLDQLGGTRRANGARIAVEGHWTMQTASGTSPVLHADSVQRLDTAAPQVTVLGAQPEAIVLCRFADKTAMPHAPDWYRGLLANTYPGLDNYWREQSYGKINLAGSAVFGWFTLPHGRSYYTGSNYVDLPSLSQDCAAAGAKATNNYAKFEGVSAVFNDQLDGHNYGGIATITLGSTQYNVPFTWMQADMQQSSIAHEMGHGWYLPHSPGADGQEYTDPYDIMSNNYLCHLKDAIYGCVGQHTISEYKSSDWLGWIAPSEVLDVGTRASVTTTLHRLALPGARVPLQVRIPIDALGFYTVETRAPAGYDRDLGISAPIAVVFYVDSTAQPHLIYTINGRTDLHVGESLTLPQPQVTIHVDSAASDGESLQLTITRAGSGAGAHKVLLPLIRR